MTLWCQNLLLLWLEDKETDDQWEQRLMQNLELNLVFSDSEACLLSKIVQTQFVNMVNFTS